MMNHGIGSTNEADFMHTDSDFNEDGQLMHNTDKHVSDSIRPNLGIKSSTIESDGNHLEKTNSLVSSKIKNAVDASYNGRVPYNQLITEALKTSQSGRMTFEEIADYVFDHYPYYRTTNVQWKVRHSVISNL